MAHWYDCAKWTVAISGTVLATGLALTGFGAPIASMVGAQTAGFTVMLAQMAAEEDERERRKAELKEATEKANAEPDLDSIIKGAKGDVEWSKKIYEQDDIKPEDRNKALEHLSQGYIKVAGIELSTNSNKNNSDVIEKIKGVKEDIVRERIAWRTRLHNDYNADMAQTQVEAQEIKAQLQSHYEKLPREGEKAQALRSKIKDAIDYLDNKVAPTHQPFIDELRTEIEVLKTLKREHEELFNKAKESVKSNAISGVDDAERALGKRREFDSKFNILLDKLRNKHKQEEGSLVLTPDILTSITDFYAVFRDPELLHNEVFEKAYQQQAERDKQA